MPKFNEDTRVKIPATIQFMRLGYNYQSLKDLIYIKNQEYQSIGSYPLLLMDGQVKMKK